MPVHDISANQDALPQIVFKHISGVSWQTLIDSEEVVRLRFNPKDVLEWHLRTFIQVCNAIAFAHSKGIIHRDIKPDNIMVGEFGEVYVLDWGIAVSTEKDDSGRFPSAASATSMAGTPVYMAPEMLGGKVSYICEETDVYLLAGVLFHILTGAAPHEGGTIREILTNVALRQPQLPATLPTELRQLLQIALNRDPKERTCDVAEMRKAVTNFLEHRGSNRIAEAAQDKLDELDRLLASEENSGQGLRARALQMFSQSRFGFQAALDAWPQNPTAQEGLDNAFTRIIEFEIHHGEPLNAESLLLAFPNASPALRKAVSSRVEQVAHRQSELEKLDQEMNTLTGTRTRSFFGLIACVGWTILPLVFETSPNMFVWTGAAFLALIGGLTLWARESMLQTRMNRALINTFAWVLCMRVALGLLCKFGYLDLFAMKTNFVGVWLTSFSMFGLIVDRRVLWCLPPAFITMALGLRYQEYMQEISSAANFVVFATLAIIWTPWKNDPFGVERRRKRLEAKEKSAASRKA